MSEYVPALVWLLSGFVCLYIAKRRNVRPTTLWAMLVAVIGPFAIPLVFVAKPEKLKQA
ncbi:hypothetical protein [Rugamonas aquatica]|uniref:hypothetical protein n=1 Tax=Rugamonas aquatica TaxID=2743357 RepID=UPI00158251C8|nr:hypothetical protein [Rugamonas aquatica]